MIAVRSSFSCIPLALQTQTATVDIDQLIIKINLSHQSDLIIIVSYIPPTSSIDVYESHFKNCEFYLNNVKSYQHVLYAGDFNLGNINWSLDCEANIFVPSSVNGATESLLVDFYNQLDLIQINSIPNDFNRFLDLVKF